MNHPTQHLINAAAVAAPTVSVMAHLSPYITVTAGILGVVWYCVLFYDRFVKGRWPKNH